MKFIGYDFVNIAMPQTLTYLPPGWQDALSFQIARRGTGPVGQQLLTGPASRLRPLMFEPLAVGNLPRLTVSSVVDSLMAEPNVGASTPSSNATDLPSIWSQRPQVLDYHEMADVMCAGFMIATFSYETQTGAGTVFQHQDSAVGTAVNLAKRKVGQIKVTMLHTNSTADKDNHDQAHTEMCLAKQLDAFLTLLETHAASAKRASGNNFVKDFKLANLAVAADIRWDHRQGNVTVACQGCVGVMNSVTNAWTGKLKSIVLTPSKAA